MQIRDRIYPRICILLPQDHCKWLSLLINRSLYCKVSKINAADQHQYAKLVVQTYYCNKENAITSEDHFNVEDIHFVIKC